MVFGTAFKVGSYEISINTVGLKDTGAIMKLILNKYVRTSIYMICLGLFLIACQETIPEETSKPEVTVKPNVTIPIVESPDVSEQVNILISETQIYTAALGTSNLLANPSFEQGQNAWSSCGGATTLNPVNNAVSGSALAVSSGCFYQTVEVSPNQNLSVSCQANVLNDTGWSGMGLGISNSSFVNLVQSPERVLTNNGYRNYSTSVQTPVNSKYATLWVYTDGTVAVDDCVLKVGEADVPQGNLLSNPNFTTQDGWQNCGPNGRYTISGGKLNVTGTACVYQTVNARAGLDYRLTCNSKGNSNVYTEIKLAMLGTDYQELSSDSKIVSSASFQNIEVAKVAPTNTAIVGVIIYSEGASTHNSCDLRVAGTTDPNPEPDPNALVEQQLTVGNILDNPSFNDQTGWTNCGPTTTFALGNGNLTVNPGTCMFQEKLGEAGKIYHLTCQAKTELPIYSVVTLNMLDANFQNLATQPRTINTSNRQWRTTLEAPANTKFVTVGFYTEGEVTYDYCYLTTSTPPALTPETIVQPAKPLGLLLPIYIDPETTQVPWNKVISTASFVPTTVVINPNVQIEDCQNPSFKAMLTRLEAANIETVGYVHTGYTRRAKSLVKADIAKFKDCVGLDGVFFDEVINSTTSHQNYYKDICTYSRTLYSGKLILNPGTNTLIPFTNEYCDVNLFIEESVDMWEEFAPYGYYGGSTDPGLAGIIHTVPNNDTALRNVVDTAYSRKLDYVYVTDKTVPNPWTELPTFWDGLVWYVSTKNASLQP